MDDNEMHLPRPPSTSSRARLIFRPWAIGTGCAQLRQPVMPVPSGTRPMLGRRLNTLLERSRIKCNEPIMSLLSPHRSAAARRSRPRHRAYHQHVVL
jgi:hypothetical protein